MHSACSGPRAVRRHRSRSRSRTHAAVATPRHRGGRRDDHLGAEALQRLHAFATENDSDVVVPREVPNRRYALGPLFEHNRPHATLADDPALLSLLTPHKMFRRQFLLENDIRFIEGRRRLEDHPFVVEAFVKAKVISVLADYPCYYWQIRDDRSNAGLAPVDWPSWYDNLRDALRVVDAHVPAGETRDLLLSHWYRTKVLGKLGGRFATRPEAELRVQLDAARALTEEWFSAAVDAHVDGIYKVRSHLLRADDLGGLRLLAAGEQGMGLAQQVDGIRHDGETIEVSMSAWFVHADGTPFLCDQQDGRWVFRMVEPAPVVPDSVRDFTDELDRVRLQ